MDIEEIKEKMNLRKNFLIEKREAQKLRKPDDLIMSIDYELDLLEESKSTIDLLLNTPK